MRPSASALRSSIVGRSASNAARPASYGIETVTSVRPASARSSSHSAPVRSSKPYANTGSSCHESKSDCSRSTARRRSRSRSQRPSRSSSARYARVETREVAVERVRLEQPASSSASVEASVSAKPAKRAERPEAVQRRVADDPPDEQAPLRVLQERPCVSGAVGDALEDVVERPDRPAEERRLRASRSRSTRSTSDRFGTIKTGWRSSTPR